MAPGMALPILTFSHLRGKMSSRPERVPLQLLKRSNNACALAIEFGETVLEIGDLLMRGVVRRHALTPS